MKRRMSSIIAELKQELEIADSARNQNYTENTNLKKRLSEIAAENESLRQDKKWLQAMHSNLLQSIQVSVIKD